jgi:predicted nucleotidyltransferase
MLEKIKTQIVKDDTVLFACLYGSYAGNNFDSMSDIDIALYFSDPSLDNRFRLIFSR